jgi:hypothetical protein
MPSRLAQALIFHKKQPEKLLVHDAISQHMRAPWCDAPKTLDSTFKLSKNLACCGAQYDAPSVFGKNTAAPVNGNIHPRNVLIFGETHVCNP